MNGRGSREAKFQREFIEWYVISKRTVYLIIAAILALIFGIAAYIYIKSLPEPEILNPERETRLVQVSGNVSIRHAQGGQTETAYVNMVLKPGDTIETASDSTAVLQYYDNSTMRVKSDSSVIVKESREDLQKKEYKSETTIQQGGGTFRSENGNNIVSTPTINVNFGDGDKASIEVGKDKKESVTVEGGTVEATNKTTGKTESLPAETKTDFQGGNKVEQVKLLSAPLLKSPESGTMFTFDPGNRIEIAFAWGPVPTAYGYKLQMSTGSSFAGNTVTEKDLATPLYKVPFPTTDGSYYWRVAGVTKDGRLGLWSEPNRVQIVVRQKPGPQKEIFIDKPQITPVGAGIVEISGSTEPGVRLRINGRDVPVGSSGKYTEALELPGGTGPITIEAENAQGRKGNRTFHYPERR